MEKKRLVYEPPQVQDLSGFGASGQGPLYPCMAGLIAQGPGPCSDGAMPDACVNGMFFAVPAPCTSGTDPATGECVSGIGAVGASCLSGNAAAGGMCSVGINV